MNGFPRETAERPPPIFEGDTKIELSPMARGADGVKRFFESKEKEKDGGKKVTKKEAAATLGFADGTIKNMLTAGKLRGDGNGGVTDESVADIKRKKKEQKDRMTTVKVPYRGVNANATELRSQILKDEDISAVKKELEEDEQSGEVESAGDGADGVVQGTNQNKHVDGADRGQQSGYYAQAEDKNGNSTDAPTDDRENSVDVEASDFYGGHVRHPQEDTPAVEKRDIPDWLLDISEKIYRKAYERGYDDGSSRANGELERVRNISAGRLLSILEGVAE